MFVVDFPAGKPQAQAMPEIYRLAAADTARAAVALPMYAGEPQWFLEGDYLLYSTSAGFLPLANGVGRWVPPEYLAMGRGDTHVRVAGNGGGPAAVRRPARPRLFCCRHAGF